MTNDRFDIEYKKWLAQVEVGEDDSVWNEIQDELDFMETWDNISAQLDVVAPQKSKVVIMKFLKPLAAAAAIILLMLLPIKYFTDETIQPAIISEQRTEDNEINELKSDKIASTKEDKKEISVIENNIPPTTGTHQTTSTYISENRLTGFIETKDTDNTSLDSDNEAIIVNRIPSRPFNSNLLLASNNAILPEFTEYQTPIYSEENQSSGFHFRVVELGLVYGYKNTWLLNHETLNALDPTKLGSALPTFHHDIGASTTIEFNKRHQVGLEFLWKSETGQNYQQYINASYIDKNIDLTYTKLQTFYYWNSKKVPGQAILGGYVARLSMAEELQEKTRYSVNDSYSEFDYGLLVGYQFNIALKNRINIKPSLRVNYNLVNIFKGDEIIPAHFKRTKNLAASFNISVSYRFF